MQKSIFRQGLRRTYPLGIAFAVVSAAFGLLSLLVGQVAMLRMALFVPLIPLPVLIIYLRYLSNPAAADFYGALPVSQGAIIKSGVLISLLYVSLASLLGIVPFFIKDAITPEVYTTWVYPNTSSYEQVTVSLSLLAMCSQLIEVFASSLLVSGLTLVIIGLTRSALVQFFLTLLCINLPTLLFSLLSEDLNKLFLNIGDSYYTQPEFIFPETLGNTLKNNFFKSIILLLFGMLMVLLGTRLIGYMRRPDVENHTLAHRISSIVVAAILGFVPIFIAIMDVLRHFVSAVFVSFHAAASPQIISAYEQYGVIQTLRDTPPWSAALLLIVAGLAVTLACALKNNRNHTKKRADALLSLGLLSAFCFGIFAAGGVYYISATRQFSPSQLAYVRFESWHNNYQNHYDLDGLLGVSYMSLEGASKGEDALAEDTIQYISSKIAANTTAIKTSDGNVYSNCSPGILAMYFDSLNGEEILDVRWEGEIMELLVNAANRDAAIIREVMRTGSPSQNGYNGGYYIINIYTQSGIPHKRRCYLTPAEQVKLEELLRLALKQLPAGEDA